MTNKRIKRTWFRPLQRKVFVFCVCVWLYSRLSRAQEINYPRKRDPIASSDFDMPVIGCRTDSRYFHLSAYQRNNWLATYHFTKNAPFSYFWCCNSNGTPLGLTPLSTKITAFGGHTIPHHGTCDLILSHPGHPKSYTFHVVNTVGPTVLGLPTCHDMKLVTLN